MLLVVKLVRNKTIIGLKYTPTINIYVDGNVRNKTIIGLKFIKQHFLNSRQPVRNKTIIGLKFGSFCYESC